MGQFSSGVAHDGPFFECPDAASLFRQVFSGHRRVINRDGDGSAGANRIKRRFTWLAEQSKQPDRLLLTKQRDNYRDRLQPTGFVVEVAEIVVREGDGQIPSLTCLTPTSCPANT
jgi:hypothetical protein